MPNGNDDKTSKPPLIKTKLRLVADNTNSPPKLKKAKRSKKEERLLGLLFHLRASRSLVSAFESAESIFLRIDTTLDYMKNHIDDSQLIRKMLVQINLAVALDHDIQEAMQKVADFAGEDFLELFKTILLGSKYVRRKARRLKAIDAYLDDEVSAHRSHTRAHSKDSKDQESH
jgi:hypothetical protein